jgi:hypothetical protein
VFLHAQVSACSISVTRHFHHFHYILQGDIERMANDLILMRYQTITPQALEPEGDNAITDGKLLVHVPVAGWR